MTLPETQPTSDDELVRSLSRVIHTFAGGLVLVGVLGALVIVPEPTVTPIGLLIGAGLGLVAWFVPSVMIRNRLTAAAKTGVAPEQVPVVVRSIVFVGLVFAEAPALLGLVISVQLGHDIGPLVLSIPLAVASMLLNVGGGGAVRRHLDRLRSPFLY